MTPRDDWAGSSENWRTDFSRFRSADLGQPLSGWAGERWSDRYACD